MISVVNIVILEVFSRGIMISAFFNPVTLPYLIAQVLSSFCVNVPGEFFWFTTGWTGVACIFTFVRFKRILKFHNKLLFCVLHFLHFSHSENPINNPNAENAENAENATYYSFNQAFHICLAEAF